MFAEFINKLAGTYQSDEARPYYARPSMAGPERCIRAMTYQALGVPAKPFPGRAIMVMDDSSWHEELTVQWMERSVIKVHSRQMPIDIPAPSLNLSGYTCSHPISGGLICGKAVKPETMHGHIDWIAQPPTGFEFLVEHKALSHFGCQRIENGELPMDNIVQACTYSAGLQRVQPDLTRILLLIKNKNTTQYIEFEMDYSAKSDALLIERKVISRGDAAAESVQIMQVIEKPVQVALDKFREVQKYAGLKMLPKRPFPYDTDYPCGYCRHGETCWENYHKEFSELPEGAALPKEFIQIAIDYKKLGKQITQMTNEQDEMKEELEAAVSDIPAKSGIAGQFIISMKPFKKTDIDKALVPPAAISTSTHYRFSLKQIKEKSYSKSEED